MAECSAVYTSARIASLQHKLLSRDRLKRMLDADSAEDALKVLYEVSYADGLTVASPYEYELLLNREASLTEELMREITPDSAVTDCFAVSNDFHNAKVLLKQKYGNVAAGQELLYRGLLDAETLKTSIETESYAFLPLVLGELFKALDKRFLNEAATPGAIDRAVDAALQRELALRLKKVRNPLVLQYFQADTDFKNISVLFRLKRLSVKESEAKAYFLEGGSISPEALLKLFPQNAEVIAESFRYSPYKQFVAALAVSVTQYERMADNYLLSLFAGRGNDLFTVNPLIWYYLGKRAEIKNIRIIMTALLNGVEKSFAEERLRDSYVR